MGLLQGCVELFNTSLRSAFSEDMCAQVPVSPLLVVSFPVHAGSSQDPPTESAGLSHHLNSATNPGGDFDIVLKFTRSASARRITVLQQGEMACFE